MIRAENNNISLTGHFMEDVNTRYGGRKHTTNGFLFLLLNYSRTSRYRLFSNTDTSIIMDSFQCPDKILIYFL